MSSKREIELHKTRIHNLTTDLESHKQSLNAERANTKNHQAKVTKNQLYQHHNKKKYNFFQMAIYFKIENYARQEEIQTNLISSLKVRIAELESQLSAQTHREPELVLQLKDAQLQSAHLEEDNRHVRAELEKLTAKIAELDRLKQLEGLVQQPQKWAELGQLAESLTNLSRSMAASQNLANN